MKASLEAIEIRHRADMMLHVAYAFLSEPTMTDETAKMKQDLVARLTGAEVEEEMDDDEVIAILNETGHNPIRTGNASSR